MFANISYQDKQAFFALLDEYFESRPHLVGGGAGAASASASPTHSGSASPSITLNANHAKAAFSAFSAAAAAQHGGGAPGGRTMPPAAPPSGAGGPPAVPTRTYKPSAAAEPEPEPELVHQAAPSPPLYSPAVASSSASPTKDGAMSMSSAKSSFNTGKASFNTGMSKFTSNSTLNKGLGKVGAGGFANKMSDRFGPHSTTAPYHAPYQNRGDGGSSPSAAASGEAPQPPPSRTLPPRAGGGGVAGLQQSKSFGHVDTSSGGAAFTTMWRDPKNGAASATNAQMAPALSKARAGPPPPVRRDTSSASPAAPAVPQAQALYDYDGGDSTDLPVQEGQVVSIVAKTSEDWWTCEDGNGRQGLVPANYMKEL